MAFLVQPTVVVWRARYVECSPKVSRFDRFEQTSKDTESDLMVFLTPDFSVIWEERLELQVLKKQVVLKYPTNIIASNVSMVCIQSCERCYKRI